MKYSTVIFDLDGTLLDTSQGIMAGASYTAIKMGIPELTLEQQRSFIGPPLLDSFMRECRFTEKEARTAVDIYRKRYKETGLYEAKHYKLVKELLVFLKDNDFKTGVATLKMDVFAKEILQHFGLTQYFDSIKGIDEKDTHAKSDIIAMCLKELVECEPSNAVMIGDSIYDAMGAEQLGMDFIAVTYGYGFQNKEEAGKSKNILIAESVSDIFTFFEL